MSGATGEPSPLRVLATRSWALAALGVVAAVVTCVMLGLWQFHRFEAKSARADLIEHNYSAPPVALTDVLPASDSPLAADDGWRTVRLTGEYCTAPECILYARNRPFNGEVGFAQLVPFRTDDGTVMVARGWVPTQSASSAPADPPEVPTGQRTIVVRLRPMEPVLAGRTNPPGQVQSIAIEELAAVEPTAGTLHRGAYGELASEDPAPADAPTPFPRPDTSLGPHLSYAVQWWAFALFFPIAWAVRARRAVLDEIEVRRRGGAAQPVRARRAPARSRDEEEEDALLDELRG